MRPVLVLLTPDVEAQQQMHATVRQKRSAETTAVAAANVNVYGPVAQSTRAVHPVPLRTLCRWSAVWAHGLRLSAFLALLAVGVGCSARGGLPPLLPVEPTGTARIADRPIVPGDLLQVTVFAAPELSSKPRVSETGEISLPLVGVSTAAGKSPRELEVALNAKLRTYMRDPQVTVELSELAPRPVYVIGEVTQPGAFTPSGEGKLTVVRAVAVARGFTRAAAPGRSVVLRTGSDGKRQQFAVNLDDVLGGRMSDVALEPDDVLYVPKAKERVAALGTIDALLRLVTFRAVF